MGKSSPEINFLLAEVEKRYGRRIATTTDFEALSVVIEHDTGDVLSSSTLKRLWGYVTLNPSPRLSTLDILSRYVGKRDFRDFCQAMMEDKSVHSTFFTAKCIRSCDMKSGDKLSIGWNPNRIVKLEYLGDSKYVVRESLNSKLEPGDVFENTTFMLGYPLYIAAIERNGEITSSYMAGVRDGLTILDLSSQ